MRGFIIHLIITAIVLLAAVKMKVNKKFIPVLVIAMFVIGMLFVTAFNIRRSQEIEAAAAAPAPVFSVRTEKAETRTLQAFLDVNANIVSSHQVIVMPDANGRLASMRVSLGSPVQRGQLLAEVDPSRPGAIFSMSPVRATVSGIVVSSPATVGSTVSTGTPLMTIAVDDSIEIEALIPEREVGQLRIGLQAAIRLEAFPGEIFPAELVQLSPVVDPVSRTKKVTLRFINNDPRISPGMFARVRLNTRSYENVVSIPQEALVESRGRTVVYVLIEGTEYIAPYVNMREVVTGATVDREVEIREGLQSGESVVVQGQQFLSDGVQVRIIGRRI
jgi:multidrug efflux pump subunit AcrA (membrane-fusion protein)